jgi:alpha-tubulin suppressor-like RCC1 family protein
MESSQKASKPQVLKPSPDPEKMESHKSGSIHADHVISIQTASCGAESSHVLDVNDIIYSTGWNEHGNLAIGRAKGVDSEHECCRSWVASSGARVVAPPSIGTRERRMLFAAGGAHIITMQS